MGLGPPQGPVHACHGPRAKLWLAPGCWDMFLAAVERQSLPHRPACASNLPAASAVLLAGFAVDVCLSFEPPTQYHSLSPFFFPSGAVFLWSVSWDRLPLPLHLKSLQRVEEPFCSSLPFSLFSPIKDMYYLQVISPRHSHPLQLLFHLWHPSLFIFIHGLHCLSSAGTQPASQQQTYWVGFEAHLLTEKATGKLKRSTGWAVTGCRAPARQPHLPNLFRARQAAEIVSILTRE